MYLYMYVLIRLRLKDADQMKNEDSYKDECDLRSNEFETKLVIVIPMRDLSCKYVL